MQIKKKKVLADDNKVRNMQFPGTFSSFISTPCTNLAGRISRSTLPGFYAISRRIHDRWRAGPRVIMYEKEDRTSFMVQKRCTFLRRVLIFFNGNLLNEFFFAR